MKKVCRNCKYWQRDSNSTIEIGSCDSDNLEYDFMMHLSSKKKDKLMYFDYECYEAGFVTEPNFGCIHFERKG